MRSLLPKLGLGLLVALALLGALEGAARWLGLGDRSALVHLEPAEDPNLEDAVRVRALGISVDVDHVSAAFPRTHDEDAVRIVLFGESAAAGFPFQPASTPARWLALRLGARRPDLRLEIVDTSIPGIHSDFFPPIARLVLDPPPDLVVVYGGNNEFLLSFLALARARGPADAVADRLADVSAGVRWLRAALASSRRTLENPRNPLSTEVFFDEPLGPLRDRVIDRFERNVRRVVRMAKDAGADVLLVRPAAALRNAVPKSSVFAPDVGTAERERFRAHLEEAARRARDGDVEGARSRLAEAARIDDGVAILHYRMGELLEGEGRTAAARDAYRRALDLDERPVRVNARTAAALERVGAAEGVPVVDAQAAFAAAAQDGVVGEDLVLDHVHLTVAGQRELAGLITDAMAARGWPNGEGWRDADVSLEEGVERLGLDAQSALHPEVQLGFLAVFLSFESDDPAEHRQRARRRFDRVLGRDPDDPLAAAGRAVLAVAEGDVDAALAGFERLAERAPATIDTLGSILDRHAGLREAFDRAGLELREGRVVRRGAGG